MGARVQNNYWCWYVIGSWFVNISYRRIFQNQRFKKKSTDRIGPMFGVMNGMTSLMCALGYGKPYSPAIVYGIG
jgi:hypothetical protein